MCPAEGRRLRLKKDDFIYKSAVMTVNSQWIETQFHIESPLRAASFTPFILEFVSPIGPSYVTSLHQEGVWGWITKLSSIRSLFLESTIT